MMIPFLTKYPEVDIKNEKADSRYLYTPYEITELPVGYRKETPFADSMLKAKGLFGARNYHYQANGNLVKDFTVLGARVYQALARDEGDSYRDDESYYNAFVYSQDTKLSGALETVPQRTGGRWKPGAGAYRLLYSDQQDPFLSGKEPDLQHGSRSVYRTGGFCRGLPDKHQDRPQCPLCHGGGTDVPLLRDPIPLCGRISGHTGRYQR